MTNAQGLGTRQTVTSAAQDAAWFADRMRPRSAAHAVSRCYRVTGDLDVQALRAAWRELVHRHEILRTTLVESEGWLVQQISARSRDQLSFVDASADAGLLRTDAGRVLTEELTAGFDLAEGPLARLTVVRSDPRTHRLLLVAHRAVADDRSLALIAAELSALYAAALAGRPVRTALPAVTRTHADLALAEHDGAAGLAPLLGWWTTALTPPPPELTLPVDRTRPAESSDAGGVLPFHWGADLAGALAAFCRAEDATPFAVLLTAFQTLLFRYGSSERVAVGVPADTRPADGARLVGPYENPLPLCADFAGRPTFRDALGRVTRLAADALDRRAVPFGHLVRALDAHRDPRRAPLCDALFVFRDEPEPPLALPGAVVTAEPSDSGAVRADLALVVGPTLAGAVEYRESLFEPGTVRLVADQLRTLLAAALARPDSPVDELPLDGDELIATAAAEADRIAAAAPADLPVHELVRAWADRRPDAPAVDWLGDVTSYRDLVAGADAVADRLRALGDVEGRAVVVRLRPGARQFAALLGVLTAGAHLVWFGAGDEGERGRAVLDDLRPTCLVLEGEAGEDELAEWYREELGGRILDLSAADGPDPAPPGATVGSSGPAPAAVIRPADRAYVAYTSGSTGRPKGIAQSHGALAQFVTWLAGEFDVGPGSRVAQWVAPEHDPALCEVFATLVAGATLCPVPEKIRANPEKLVDWLAQQRITLLQTVPSFARELLRVITRWRAAERLAALDRLLLMGEALPGDLVNGLRAALPLTRLANLYGPTETIAATWHEITGNVLGTAPIGRSIPGRQVLVLDDADRPCPTGVTGEVVIRSPYVAAGYLGLPVGPAFAPLRGDDPVPCYRTGDLGRRRPDGLLEYRGRRDFQVKLYGTRVELTDIEAALAGHPSVAECAVVAVADRDGLVTRLVVYVVPAGSPAPDAWRAQLRRRFGRAMLPATFKTLDEPLPRNLAGKVDRRRLPDPGPAHVQRARGPRTPVERDLAALWSELLGTDRIAAEDTFFGLGGHSLQVPRLLYRIRERFGVAVSLEEFFAHPSLVGLATLVDTVGAWERSSTAGR
ncbi:AMP-binding protein [Longispora sp. K20-0274]|uniref:non-ribosomal peptide synthetase n=1 Tax=Longispora sp. K20-0274 TaxID=3088255 RepID=UPI00399B5277